LNALIPETDIALEEELTFIRIELIKPSPFQPRQSFDEESLKELAKSIEESGVLQPIIVRRDGDEYQIVIGERRYRACMIAGLKTIPAVIREVSDREAMQIALIENIHREDLNPIEEATAYQQLIDEFNLRQEDVAKLVGRSRPYIANSLRLLSLPDIVKEYLIKGDLTAGHARALLAFNGDKTIINLAKRTVKEGLSVREVERLSRVKNGDIDIEDEAPGEKVERKIDIALRDITDVLQNNLSRKVKIFYNKGRGRLVFEFYSDDDLNILLEQLGYKGRR